MHPPGSLRGPYSAGSSTGYRGSRKVWSLFDFAQATGRRDNYRWTHTYVPRTGKS